MIADSSDPFLLAAEEIDPPPPKPKAPKETLREFIHKAWHLVVPDQDLEWNWHHDRMCQLLESVTDGSIKRVLINIPPGCSKSLICSVLWPAWEWTFNPHLRYLTAAYSSSNTIRDNKSVRDIVTSDWYQGRYDLTLASDQSAKVRFDTTERGLRIATSVGGMGTGEHPDRIIIDDPLKAKDALSNTKLEECKYWFDRTISTRVNRNPGFVVVMQRLHEEDLAGHLLSQGGWHHLMLPMRYDPKRADPMDPRTEPGELLWPELFPEEKVREEELRLGQFGASGQLQQNPVPEGGGLFKREWLPVVDIAPTGGQACRGWDTAGTQDGGDWTAGVRLREVDGVFYVEHVVRGQWGPGGVDAVIKSTADTDGKGCMVREEREGGSAGKAVTNARAKALKGYDYAGVPITGDKVVRASPFRAQAEAGNVKVVRGEWNEVYIDELCSFPVGRHDDQVDGTSCAFNSLVDGRAKKGTPGVWGRGR